MDVGEGVHRPVDDVERGGSGGCEACVALARGRVKLTGYCAISNVTFAYLCRGSNAFGSGALTLPAKNLSARLKQA